jgi:hypothetical protein
MEEERKNLSLMQKLPVEIVDMIYDYIPNHILVWIRKDMYMRFHSLIRPLVGNQYENFIRDMIRKDCDFVFHYILEENFYKWIKINKYVYKASIYPSYVSFLQNYCLEHGSTKCRNEILQFLGENGLTKNNIKKNSIKNISIRWRM